jgi:dihydrofolate synthase / folylpolyglutamate synthase
MTYAEAIRYLYELRWFGTKLGLENSHRLAALAGDPHKKLRFIHAAGTNGKGSTCAMLESIYRASGLRVGLFTSPHLVSFSERIQVNRIPISEKDVVRLVEQMRELLRGFEPEHHPTFFEVVVVMALVYFVEQHCDLVIWETGLGGRLDSTNIVTPLASVITNIQFDHEKWLGHTLASIAKEKAGIIKPGKPVISGVRKPEPRAVITETAAANGSPLVEITEQDVDAIRAVPLPLIGEHQKRNAALAVATVRTLRNLLPVDEQTIVTGLSTVSWPGRLQRVRTESGAEILLDAAHNPAGAQALADALTENFKGAPVCLAMGILQDKDWELMCRILAPLADRIILVPVHTERTADPHTLAEACRRANPAVTITECRSLAEALKTHRPGELFTIAGSLYLVGEAMELLSLSPGMKTGERGLNDWSQSRGNADGKSPG